MAPAPALPTEAAQAGAEVVNQTFIMTIEQLTQLLVVPAIGFLIWTIRDLRNAINTLEKGHVRHDAILQARAGQRDEDKQEFHEAVRELKSSIDKLSEHLNHWAAPKDRP